VHRRTSRRGDGLAVRPRQERDLDDCEQIARLVQSVDGYPAYVPGNDLRRFLVSPDALAAWVAVARGDIVGHVALHRRSSEPVMNLASRALGVDAARLGVVARLLVTPSTRRSGAGRLLLETATAAARARSLVPILDVGTRHAAAIALYDAAGWTRLGTIEVEFRGGVSLEEFVYVAPEPQRLLCSC
jgi:GNAT superfamily N-acetyltransferase